MVSVTVDSPEISRASLHASLPWWTHVYTFPFLALYPLLAYAYFVRYDDWLKSEEWTFLACVSLGAGHALSFLATRWSTAARAFITCRSVNDIRSADSIRIVPAEHRGKGGIVKLRKKDSSDPSTYTFSYQQDTYVLLSEKPLIFGPLPYPSTNKPPLSSYQLPSGSSSKGLSADDVPSLLSLYNKNEFHIPIPAFGTLFAEHATAPFFVFQIFCVALWCLDEYWYYSIFTLFMLIMFECTVVWQRLKTLTEFRSMSIEPYPISCYRDGKWFVLQSDELLPGDIVSLARQQTHKEGTTVPADLLLLRGTCIVNEAMLSGESTPLLKESIELFDGSERLDVDGAHKNSVLFGGTKVLQSSNGGVSQAGPHTPDGGCLAVVLRTGFGTAQGSLVRTMIFSSERVSANTLESFLFIAFLLVFALAASSYVWQKGLERGLKKSKLLLDCVMIVTSVVPPELPMELSLAVNASLVALQKLAIFCTEPFRIPFAGKVEVCAFDKTGTITAESLVVEGVAGVHPEDRTRLVNVRETKRDTALCLAAAHALVRLDDGMIVGDPMEKAALEALDWHLQPGDRVSPTNQTVAGLYELHIRRRFQFSSALKRMSTIATMQRGAGSGKARVSVKGAPETIKTMLASVPERYDETFKYFTRRGSRVLALAWKEMDGMSNDRINHIGRDEVESKLNFAGFLVFHCPLKEDAIQTLKDLADSSHRCIMITGDNPLTAVHVARDVEIVDREALILDLKENPKHDADLEWRTVDETLSIPVDPSKPVDQALLNKYDICITGSALRQLENQPAWLTLVQHAWVYARVSPAQKEFILTTLKSLGYITLMAGDGTNDVGALKQAHVGVALLDGTPEDLKKIAEHQRMERIKKVYETQLNISLRFNQPPPPVPPALASAYPEVVEAQARAAAQQQNARQRNPLEKFDLNTITNSLADMDAEDDVPKIKLGDASCAAPFTSKLSHTASIAHIIRQGRCTLVATVQMYKILALNCLISAYALSVQYLDGIKYGDYQVTITGMLMSVCFLCISRAKPVEKLSRERPLGNIFNLYVLLSILIQFGIHIVALVYITALSNANEDRGPIDLEAKFEPNLLNTAIYLLGLSQQVSTFAINFQGRPFREGIRENSALYYGLLGASAVAFAGATDFVPEFSRWLQIVEMPVFFRVRLTAVMIADFVGCWAVEVVCKALFAVLEPKEMLTRGRERRERRRQLEGEKRKAEAATKKDE
ncbi:endoplasmic reticulum Ca-transporting P-type ATPase [Fomitiporia mediterranea MF3/22]|uniref:endoplasmic reticulum Ca-transporting P-type ATPase n=1 Tax=Fomitiporia mediterranea (strain MF3/22) TaxID=694068 RepID=UPI0004408F23|nr:endoplasmic reticulum Ca-transporting P-type ATPase [Fomitiporia mediterranea MF3/22]EJD08490.1 endoplasmic reticulum Ca-transporting P-type ATPase [Fomitiporia mediterranea MF3/22]